MLALHLLLYSTYDLITLHVHILSETGFLCWHAQCRHQNHVKAVIALRWKLSLFSAYPGLVMKSVWCEQWHILRFHALSLIKNVYENCVHVNLGSHILCVVFLYQGQRRSWIFLIIIIIITLDLFLIECMLINRKINLVFNEMLIFNWYRHSTETFSFTSLFCTHYSIQFKL